ncbi:MAG: hypothetical protein HKO99_12970 [Xanthomonadales bacterium]|nr:hypothetical protein [Xanthomonadales bacterium]
MMKSYAKYVAAMLLLMTAVSSWAGCREDALEGDWTVFYRDNGFPTSVLAPDEVINIQFDHKSRAFSVSLSDPEWRSWEANWDSVCVDGRTVLLGAIQRRHGRATLVIEISRVADTHDLLRNAAGVVRERQIKIRFPQPFAASGLSEALAELAERGLLASHPGHAHGWE